ncbi:kinase-like domain-containing protein [Pavlovales sp. CCMP2436]|nr:kinase-like domain-containing protein [Pavlovales sp. CCMP2436]
MFLSMAALQHALSGDLVGKDVLVYSGPGKGTRARVSSCQGSNLVLEAGAVATADGVLVLPVAASTEAYFREHLVGFDRPVGDGFLDPGRMSAGGAGVLPSPESLSRMRARSSGAREVLLVDARLDGELRVFMADATARASSITDTRERIKFLGELDSPIVKLGDLDYGVCRHRALLFKVLCDALGLSCALTHVVDVMHRPGEIYVPDDARCASYHRLAERGGGGDAHHGAGLQSLPPPAPREEWYVRPADVQMERGPDGGDVVLGSGGFGTVYAARHKGAQRVAVKRLNAAGTAAASEFVKEVSMLHRLKHSHIMLFVGACDDPGNHMIVKERIWGGSLADVLERDPASVAWAVAGRRALRDTARALCYLHTREPPVVHWDVKPASVLYLSGLGLFKLADVGLASNMSSSQARAARWTPSYAAPEVLLGGYTNAKADVFSFGVIVEALLVGRLVQVCLGVEPALRPSAVDLVNGLEDDAEAEAAAAAAVAVAAAAAAAVAQADELAKSQEQQRVLLQNKAHEAELQKLRAQMAQHL